MLLRLACPVFLISCLAVTVQAHGVGEDLGKALVLDGREFLVARDIAALDRDLAEAYTIELWLRIDEVPPGRQEWTIFAKPDSYELFLGGPDHPFAKGGLFVLALAVQVEGDGPRDNMYMTNPDEDGLLNGWHHFVFQGDPVGYEGGIDGTLRGGGPFLAIPDSNKSLHVGGHPARDDSFFRGAIDELRISASKRYEIIYLVPINPFQKDPETTALWHFDEFPSGSYSDSIEGHRLVRTLAVSRRDKLTTTWGHIRRQGPGTHTSRLPRTRQF